MPMAITILGYIDPNTSQHVFSLLGPILACLATLGGLGVTALVFVRHRIAAYLRRASWTSRIAVVSIVTGVLAIVITVILYIAL